jgi:hypothetical protein
MDRNEVLFARRTEERSAVRRQPVLTLFLQLQHNWQSKTKIHECRDNATPVFSHRAMKAHGKEELYLHACLKSEVEESGQFFAAVNLCPVSSRQEAAYATETVQTHYRR